jgi:dTDP-4-dehydrorhamnose 3,5-epimerase
MKVIKENSGLILYSYPKILDERGFFQKTFNDNDLKKLNFSLKEQYFSLSHKNVVRGFHFQNPPFESSKLILCIKGKVLDVVIDLRKNSDTFLKCFKYELSEKKSEMLFIPVGFGHAFLGLESENILLYNIDQVYSKENDSGILWDSSSFKWPVKNPKISQRDKSFVNLKNFKSPF